MRIKQFLHTKTGIASVVVFIALILGIGALAVMNLQPKGFRSIQVFKAEGAATLTRKEQVLSVHNGMQLTNGDMVSQPDEGNTQLLLDDDKYVVLEPCTTIQLLATGKEPDSNTTIHLTEGSITNQLRAPLSGNSTYEVTTPVGTMMVRGTTFRVTVIKNADGSYSSTLEVFSGTVGVRLLLPDKTMSEEVFIEAGKGAEIYGNQEVTVFVFTNEDIKYDTLPTYVIKQLVSWHKEGVLIMDKSTLETLEKLLLPKESPGSSRKTTVQTPEPSPIASEQPPKAYELPPQAAEVPFKTPVPLPQTPAQTAPEQPASAPAPESSSAAEQDSVPSPGSGSKPRPNSTSPAPGPADYTVTFRTGSDQEPGEIFAVQNVRDGETAAAPLLSPSPNFTWYVTGSSTPFTFDTPIHSDLILYNQP